MSIRSQYSFSRRRALLTLGAVAGYRALGSSSAGAQSSINGEAVESNASPAFAQGGPDAKRYGFDEGYPVPGLVRGVMQGNPWEPKYRVGAFSHLDEIYSTQRISRAATPWEFKRSTADVSYRFRGQQSSLTDYLS